LERRLAAILAADVVGYSRLEGLRAEILDPLIARHHGRVVKLMGDGFLVEFASVVDALNCALAWQDAVEARAGQVPEDRALRFRIGVNLGDVMVKGDDVYGGGVNVAARLEVMADPGSVLVSRTVFDHAKGKVPATFEDLGKQELKNIAEPVRVFRVSIGSEIAETPSAVKATSKFRWLPAIGAVFVLLVVAAAAALWLRPWEPREEPASVERMAFPLPDKPSIAVLPFANISGDPEQEYFADGMTDDLITDLSKVSGLFVIARNSTFNYKDQAVVIRQVAEDLGVRYVLEGSVRRAGNEIRINAQLIDATTGGHLWAERYDRDYADIFDLQDEVIGRIVSAMAVQLTDAEQQLVERRPTDNLEAYEAYLKAEQGHYSYMWQKLGPALGFYQKAIELDPNFAEAHAGYGRLAIEYLLGFDTSRTLGADEARRRAYESVRQALALNPALSRAHAVLGLLRALDGDYEEAVASAHMAVSLDPNSAPALVDLALVLTYAGRSSEALTAMETALRLEPHPPSYYLFIQGRVLFMNSRYALALEVLGEVRQELTPGINPDVGGIRLFYVMTLAALGRLEEARETASKDLLRRFWSRWWNVAAFRHLWAHHKRREDLERLLNALRQAGFPEWPSGYQDPGWQRLDGDAIKDLVYGHTWFGRSQNMADTFALNADEQGGAKYFQSGRYWEGTVSVEEDRLCYRIPALMLSRKFCGPVYRNPAGTHEDRNEYVAVDVYDVHHFSLKE
jgi:TolB-like protein